MPKIEGRLLSVSLMAVLLGMSGFKHVNQVVKFRLSGTMLGRLTAHGWSLSLTILGMFLIELTHSWDNQMKPPTLITKNTRLVDHEATGQAAKSWRESYRVTLAEVASWMQLNSPAQVAHLETGRTHWTALKMSEYVAAVNHFKPKH